jgi:hypothetical protein
MIVYGVINKDNIFTDISTSEKGCKRFATNNGFNLIGYRNVNSYHVITSHKKEGSKWIKIN